MLTKPLLLFYGMVDLAKALFISTYGKPSPSDSHGLRVGKEWSGKLENYTVEVMKDGTYPQFQSCYKEVTLFKINFTIKDLLSLVPEIKTEFEIVYGEKSKALKVIRTKRGINIIDTELGKYGDVEILVKKITGFDKKYSKFHEIDDKILFFNKDYEADDPRIIRSINGEEYLLIPSEISGRKIELNELSIHYLIMFLLGNLSRYNPEEWGNLLKGEDTGEIYILQKFLEIAKRKFPNLILNELRERDFVFVGSQATVEELSEEKLDQIYDYVKRKLEEAFARRF